MTERAEGAPGPGHEDRAPRARAASGGREGPPGTARDRALRLLGVRWRSRRELERRLARAGYGRGEVAAVLEELERAGLIDDRRFARELVRDRAGRRLSGDRLIAADLRRAGVEEELAAEALAEAGEERERAFELAGRRATRLIGLRPEVAFARLVGLLLRRGYPWSLAREAARAALAEALRDAPWEPPDP